MANRRNLEYSLELGNFVCVAVQDKKLLDLFEERVWPLFSRNVTRASGETYEYQFHDIKIGKLLSDVCVYGRLVQRMKIAARQKMTIKGDLTPTNETLDSDPSSVFILRLKDHKFLVIPEQPRSPKMGTFKWIFEKLIAEEYSERFREVRKEFLDKNGKKRLSAEMELEFKNILDSLYPKIDFHLTTIGDKESASELLKKFDVVQSVSITAKVTNNEDYNLDEELLRKHRELMTQMGGVASDLTVRNSTEGLKKEKVKALVEAATESGGNTGFRVSGKGASGVKIRKSEADAQISVKIPKDEGESTKSFLEKALGKFDAIVASGVVKLATIANGDDDKKKSEAILKRLQGSNS